MLTCLLLQVFRYAALGSGILYGFYHQSKLTAASKLAAANREYERKQNLIAQAKAEFTKKNSPASQTQGGGGTLSPALASRQSHPACPEGNSTAIGLLWAQCSLTLELAQDRRLMV